MPCAEALEASGSLSVLQREVSSTIRMKSCTKVDYKTMKLIGKDTSGVSVQKFDRLKKDQIPKIEAYMIISIKNKRNSQSK